MWLSNKSPGKTLFEDAEMHTDMTSATLYKVVKNEEEQFSIWPQGRENALGWVDAGMAGSKEECLAYIKENWTDMRPLSLREKMAGASA
jgi:MbtH protein